MKIKNDNDLFYTCGLIEHIGRTRKVKRGEVVAQLGTDLLHRIYQYADVLHSDSIDHVADEYCEMANITDGNFDNVGDCKYEAPERWTIAGVYSRLVEDVMPDDGDPVAMLQNVYSSWVSDAISDYNTDFFYQPRSYIAACYEADELLE
ncbi:MAG: hypothetical protein Q4C41_05455 [Eggerthellaceae bacterium]|nr:hypothetical protein [Eggerthellaceae bacterium]